MTDNEKCDIILPTRESPHDSTSLNTNPFQPQAQYPNLGGYSFPIILSAEGKAYPAAPGWNIPSTDGKTDSTPGWNIPPIKSAGGKTEASAGGDCVSPTPMSIPVLPAVRSSTSIQSKRMPDYCRRESGMDGDIVVGFGFSEKSIRRAFIRKVYGILSVQLILTASLIALCSFHEGVKDYVQHSPGLTLFSYLTALVLLLVIACGGKIRRKSPHNVILLGLFTVTYGFVIGVISSTYELEAVALAVIITAIITLGLTAYAFQTKVDFTAMGGVLFCCLLVMMVFGLLMSFFPQIELARKIYSCVGALMFSVYLIYDTQLMIGGNHKCSISPEEYVFAALNIYMDIIAIFLYILRMMGRNNN